MAKIDIKERTTADLIYSRYVTSLDRGERDYLGASVIGDECWRALWYAYRWAYKCDPEDVSPRVLRLFDTGHREEQRIIEELRAGGVYVLGEQTEFRALGGHLRGHIDGIASGLPEAPKEPHIIEIKTHNDKSFKAMLKDGLKKSKPMHYAQLLIYMHHLQYKRGMYIAVNKNDESIYVERIGHGRAEIAQDAKNLLDKAEQIIDATTAPPKLHEDPDKPGAYVCGWCPAKGVCHDKQFARRNCRTCISGSAVTDHYYKNATWHCDRWDTDLNDEMQRRGCADHRYLPSLVPGKQIDADKDDLRITYEMANGEQWTDRGEGWVDLGVES
jgi:hypothetical protein